MKVRAPVTKYLDFFFDKHYGSDESIPKFFLAVWSTFAGQPPDASFAPMGLPLEIMGKTVWNRRHHRGGKALIWITPNEDQPLQGAVLRSGRASQCTGRECVAIHRVEPKIPNQLLNTGRGRTPKKHTAIADR
ncbi:hypothetical protein CIHG_10081 [Coccidioides immitis H538.4]|uniref:Uncharacterized protein n=3 Tax=Coccidioides immitis TaxID=5501 RepID=A0A0J8U3K3_COCIT|nr:hypothetical protein CIRG_05176 [Coccidioides immitis RMSCC 2394]KMU81382.1 hypothetical protein CISG_09071 [Coccidioides immitis RMSCC 3703]KMU92234.1 hypothetical protein CIHG_10081 [Coccidioides immitis H538.4]